jgi:hypothetical protein
MTQRYDNFVRVGTEIVDAATSKEISRTELPA